MGDQDHTILYGANRPKPALRPKLLENELLEFKKINFRNGSLAVLHGAPRKASGLIYLLSILLTPLKPATGIMLRWAI